MTTAPTWAELAADYRDPPDDDGSDRELALKCSTDLRVLIREAWPILEPSRPFVWSWHIDCEAEHLMAVSAGEIPRLLLNQPPGTTKSSVVAVLWPAWEWLTSPHVRWIFASYAETFAFRDSRKMRNLIRSRGGRTEGTLFERRGYQGVLALLGQGWMLAIDQDAKGRYDTTAGGMRLATSVSGQATGDHADRIVADDPLNPRQARSTADRTTVNRWWDETMSSRFIDENAAAVIVHQRLHDMDITGHLLAKESGWHHLCLPAEYNPAHPFVYPAKATLPSGRVIDGDLRTEPGELLDARRLSADRLVKLRKDLGTYAFCTPAETPILMADWTSKPISEVVPGDQVIGFKRGRPDARAVLQVSTVEAVTSRIADVVSLEMASGRTVRCTPDHRWYTARKASVAEPGRKMYQRAAVGRRLMFVCPPYDEASDAELLLWSYLAGIFDGEGTTCSSGALISQSPDANPEVFAQIRATLDALDLSHTVWVGERCPGDLNPKWGRRGQFTIHAKADLYRKLIRLTPTAKRVQMAELLVRNGHQFIRDRDRVEAIHADGTERVYALTTTTGNYVAWGYASSNSGQYDQQPAPEGGGMVKSVWWARRWQPGFHRYLEHGWDRIIQSWDMAFKDEKDSDFVVGQILGFHGAHCYVLAQVRGRFDFTTTLHVVKALTEFEPFGPLSIRKLVEDKANGTAVINALRDTVTGLIPIEPQGSKYARAAAQSPRIEAGDVWLPAGDTIPCPEFYVDKGGQRHELVPTTVQDFIHEHSIFPAGANDDQVDALSQGLTWANPQDPGPREAVPPGPRPPGSIMGGVMDEKWAPSCI